MPASAWHCVLRLRQCRTWRPRTTCYLGGRKSGSLNPNLSPGSGRRASPTGTMDSGTPGSEMGVLGLPDVLRQRAMAELGDLERGALIGRGSFGRVYKGRWRGAGDGWQVGSGIWSLGGEIPGPCAETSSGAGEVRRHAARRQRQAPVV